MTTIEKKWGKANADYIQGYNMSERQTKTI